MGYFAASWGPSFNPADDKPGHAGRQGHFETLIRKLFWPDHFADHWQIFGEEAMVWKVKPARTIWIN